MATTSGYDFEMETPSMNGKPIVDFQLERMKLQAG